VLSERGRHLVDVWKRSEELDDRLEALLLDMRREGGVDGLDPAGFGAQCAARDIEPADVPDGLVDFDRSAVRFCLTREGGVVAEIWDAITNDDPRHRLDIDYWPEPDEEKALSPTWDWADDPLASSDA
jgi:hypothetical protein